MKNGKKPTAIRLKLGRKLTKAEIAAAHQQPHIQKAMSMTYDIEPFIKAGLISPERTVKSPKPKARRPGATR